jgi:hypothetical protein
MKRRKADGKTNIALISLCILLSAVVIVLWALADRYLIRHVDGAGDAALSPALSESSSQTAETVIDDWHYQSDGISITVEKREEGTGKNTITYYVADVRLQSAESLRSAFADGLFGRNIIDYTSAIAEDNKAILAINGDYYGFRSDGILIRNGIIYRDEPARTGLAIYADGSMAVYDETSAGAEALVDSGVIHTLSFGPALVKDGEVSEDLEDVRIDANFGNRDIDGANPRTGIGMIEPNHFVFIVVDGRSAGYSKGMTLRQFAELFASYGCTQAYNLDGGGSSTLYFNGRVVNNPLGKEKERGTSDILYIGG